MGHKAFLFINQDDVVVLSNDEPCSKSISVPKKWGKTIIVSTPCKGVLACMKTILCFAVLFIINSISEVTVMFHIAVVVKTDDR